MTTWCEDCDNVHPASRKDGKPWEWRCLQYPVREGYGFVSQHYSPDPPYGRCINHNEGDCLLFTPRRDAPEPKPNKEPDQ